MSRLSRSKSSRIPAVLVGLFGAGFCIAAALGAADPFCVTEGCALYAEYTFLGFKLWWWGAAAFGATTLAALVGPRWGALGLASLCLLLDCGLLAWMAFSAPCFNCLVAGLLFLLLFFGCLKAAGAQGAAGRALVILWLFVFSPNFFGAAIGEIRPWPVYGPPEATVKLFFSPSCEACKRVIFHFLPHDEGGLGLYPVLINIGDLRRMVVMEDSLATGRDIGQAILDARNETLVNNATQAGWLSHPGLSWRLLKNKIAFVRMGGKGVPLIQMTGIDGPAPINATQRQ